MESVIPESINDMMKILNTGHCYAQDRYDIEGNPNHHFYLNILSDGTIEFHNQRKSDNIILFETTDVKHMQIFINGMLYGTSATKVGFITGRLV